MPETNYKILRPDPILQKYVDYFWAGEIYLNEAEQNSFQHLAPASTTLDLIFFCEGSFKDDQTGDKLSQNGIIYGQKNSFYNYSTTSKKASLFGIKMKPSVLLSTLNMPASEITEQQIDLRVLFGSNGDRLTDFILSEQTAEAKTTAFSTFLKAMLNATSSKFQRLEKFIESVNFSANYGEIDKLIDDVFYPKDSLNVILRR